MTIPTPPGPHGSATDSADEAVLRLDTPRLELIAPRPSYAAAIAAYYKRNAAHLRVWEPVRPPTHMMDDYWRQQLAASEQAAATGQVVRTFMIPRSREHAGLVIGSCSLTDVVRGPRMDALLGYSLDRDWQGQGFMTEALEAIVNYAFDVLNLNRVSANYMPSNQRSARLLARLGFQTEGLARRLVAIDGTWQDHVLTSKLNPRAPAPDAGCPP